MDRINSIIGPAMAAVGVILFLFPKLRESNFIKRLLMAFIAIGCLVSFFNSDWYLHRKYYDVEKIKFQLKQLPHVIKTDSNQIYSYVLIVENNYPPHIKIKSISANLNSRMPFIDYDVLLSDRKKSTIHVDLKGKSNILLTTAELRGGDILCLSFRCSPMLGNMPKNMTLSLQNIPIKFNYELFQVPHEVPPERGMRGVKLANKQYNQQAIIFEKIIVLDHRQVFDKDIEYQYGQYSIDDGLRSVSILCSSDKFLSIKYNGPHGILNYKSKCKICPDCKKIDVVRIMIFRDDFFLLEGTFEFEKDKG
jgi:hypothetical protein